MIPYTHEGLTFVKEYLIVCGRCKNESEKESALIERGTSVIFNTNQALFLQVPGCPIAYWAGDSLLRIFDYENTFL